MKSNLVIDLAIAFVLAIVFAIAFVLAIAFAIAAAGVFLFLSGVLPFALLLLLLLLEIGEASAMYICCFCFGGNDVQGNVMVNAVADLIKLGPE